MAAPAAAPHWCRPGLTRGPPPHRQPHLRGLGAMVVTLYRRPQRRHRPTIHPFHRRQSPTVSKQRAAIFLALRAPAEVIALAWGALFPTTFPNPPAVPGKPQFAWAHPAEAVNDSLGFSQVLLLAERGKPFAPLIWSTSRAGQ